MNEILLCSLCGTPYAGKRKNQWPVCLECDRVDSHWGLSWGVSENLRRALSYRAPATLTLTEWFKTLEALGWTCAYCQVAQCDAIDHFIPLREGGGTTKSNCVPACKSCNSKKGKFMPDDPRLSYHINNVGAVAIWLAQFRAGDEILGPGWDGLIALFREARNAPKTPEAQP